MPALKNVFLVRRRFSVGRIVGVMTVECVRRFQVFVSPLLTVFAVILVYWKLALTNQYTFLAHNDGANMILPRMQAEVTAIRHWSLLLWNPSEWFGQPPIGMVEPGVTSPFTFLLAIAPLHHGHIQLFYVHLWFVLLHCLAALFEFWFLRDIGVPSGPASIGGILFATMGYIGDTGWPQHLQPAIFAPLVLLFLLRSLRGRAPLSSAAWAGVALGTSWLCGHHEPSLILSLAVAATGLAFFLPGPNRRPTAKRIILLFCVMALVSAVKVLPAVEYGRLATRWIATGTVTWNQSIPFLEHEQASLKPPDLIHVAIPGGNGIFADPFVGVVALSLAAIAIGGSLRRAEIRFFTALALGSILYAMAGSDAAYGLLYALVPVVRLAREPVVAVFVFQTALAGLSALGAEALILNRNPSNERKVVRVLVWLGGGVFALIFVLTALKPAIGATTITDTDPRPGVTGLVALLLAAVYYAHGRKALRPALTILAIGLIAVIEQGVEVSRAWVRVQDTNLMAILNILDDTQDLGDWLRRQPNPKRVELNSKDIAFNFGDWFGVDAGNAYGASILTQTVNLGWWDVRMGRMYGLNYLVSRTGIRDGFIDVFTGRTGVKVWHDPNAFPRAWTVHQVLVAPNEKDGASMVNNGGFDLRTTALTVRSKPHIESCPALDRVTRIDEKPSSVRIDAEMACKGMLVVSDNFYPGWGAEIDGHFAGIWKVNTAIRGVVVPSGHHTIMMSYRPLSVYGGFACMLLGFGAAITLQCRHDPDGVDVFC